MKREQSYSSQQSHSSFQPQSTFRKTPFDRATLGQGAQHSSSNVPQGQQEYKLRAGDTLWGIAQKELGDGRQWHELQKPNGSHFTEQEAHKLQIGSSVYIPEQKTANFHVKSYTNGFGGNLHEDPYKGGSDRLSTQIQAHNINVQQVNSNQPTKQAVIYPGVKAPNNPSAKLAPSEHSTVNHTNTQNKKALNSKESDHSADTIEGAAIGISVAGGKVPRLASSPTPKEPRLSTPSSSSPLPQTWAERERLLGRLDQPSRNPALQAAKGRITDTAWKEHLNHPSSKVAEVVSQPRWRDPHTGKQMSFPDAKYRSPDLLARLKNGENHAYEIKSTPLAAESSTAVKQGMRDLIAQEAGALLGKGKGPHVPVDHVATKIGLPILGPGGNTAPLGATKKHVIITPRLDRVAHDVEHVPLQNTVKGVSEGAAKGVARGVLRGASRAAMPLAAAMDAYDLTKTYQQDGFGSKFRSKAAGVAGGWGGAALGAAGGAAIGTRQQSALIAALVQLNRLQSDLGYAKQKTQALSTLLQAGAVPRFDYLDTRNKADSLQTEIAAQAQTIRQAEQAYQADQKNADRLKAERQSEILTQINQQQQELTDLEGKLAQAREQRNQNTIRAAVPGIVYNIKVTKTGAGVQSGEELLSIMPEGEDLILEAKVQNQDIGFVRSGMPVKVKLATFPYQEFGMIEATVRKISPNAVNEQNQGLVFPVQIQLKRKSVPVKGQEVPLTPGMVATGEIVTRQKTVLSFLLDPITASWDQAFSIR